MKTIITIDKVKETYQVINSQELSSIRGGDLISDLLNTIFVPHNDVTQQMYDTFKANLIELSSTTIGHNILKAILEDGEKIKISGINPGALGAYDPGINTLYIGNYINLSDVKNFDPTAHELYHAYQDVVKAKPLTYFNGTIAEVDAQLFARMAEIQFDQDRGISYSDENSHVYHGQEYATWDIDYKHTTFRNAWEDILKNHNFTVENYNILIANLIGGSSYSGTKNITPAQENVTSHDIFNLFSTYYTGYKLINTYDDNSGGGYDNYGWDAYANNTGFNSFMQNIWAMQNQGYVFYTSSYTVNNETYFPTQYGNGWMWATQDPIINNSNTVYEEPNMTEWFAFYNSAGWESNPAYNGGGWGEGYMASYGG